MKNTNLRDTSTCMTSSAAAAPSAFLWLDLKVNKTNISRSGVICDKND